MTDANLLAPMELEHRPCEAVLAGDCLCLHTICYATGGLGAAAHAGSIQPPPDLFATFSVEKVGLNKLRCPAKGATTIERKTDNSRAPKAVTVPSRTDSHSPAKGKPALNPNGSSPMCNRVYRARPDEIVVAEAHLPSPMEVEHRPREAVLAGSCLWLRSTRYATGGLGGNEVPRRQWRMKRYAVPMRHRAGTAPASPRHCRIVDGYGAC